MKRLILTSLLALPTHALAIEGIWQPQQLPVIEAQLKQAGIAVDPKQLAELTRYPMNAVVSLGGFCTASFVSPMGLIVTNHHCAFGSIQFNSRPERNLIEQGFLARTLGEELPAEPSLRVFVTESITEVSDRVREGLADDFDGLARFAAIDRAKKALVAGCEQDPGYRCDVYVYHGGAQYFLVRQMQIRDLRLVYAPAAAIGNYGGEVDNWMWPRHTGDFAYYRAYVGPDGKAAEFSESNVPYRPKSHLRLQPAGLEDGDFAMVVGYPGRTNLHRLAEEVADTAEWSYPQQIAKLRKSLALIEEHTRGRPDAAIKYASSVAGASNYLKKFEGTLEGFSKAGTVRAKATEEAAILKWARKHDQAEGLAGHAALRAQLAAQRAWRERDSWLQTLGSLPLYAAARDLVRLSVERAKPDAERQVGFQLRDEPRLDARLQQLDRRYDPRVDRALLQWTLGELVALPAGQRIPELDRWVAGGDEEPTPALLAKRLDELYADTRIGDAAQRAEWFKADRAAIAAADDPALELARALLPALLRIEDDTKRFQGEELRNRPAWMATRIAYARASGEEVYADANNSLRISFGNVGGYRPRDGVRYEAFTDLAGLVEKHTGEPPFDATARQLAAIEARNFGPYAVDGTVPVNFVADLHITNGNSGSPILNARAELVGLAFDGNHGAIGAEWLFDPKITRTIGVDVRYMLWVMDAVDGAHRLLEEMGVKPAFAR
jgi:hypothetical protein